MAGLGWLFAWAKENGIELPLEENGSVDIQKLLELYDEWRKSNKSNGAERDSYFLTDEILPKSLSAKWANYEITLHNGKTAHFAEGSRLQNKEVFAGKGCKRKIDEEDRLVRVYGNPPGSWKKIKANAVLVDEDGEERQAEIHWYEADGGEKEEIKFKKWIT